MNSKLKTCETESSARGGFDNSGVYMQTLILGSCLQVGIMGILTPYASGPSPVYYGSGYLPVADYWRLGAIFGVIFFATFPAIGVLWMLAIP